MAVISTRQCDQCHRMIQGEARRFRLNVELNVINSHTRVGRREFADICSERCLVDALTSLIHETEVKTGEGVSLTVDPDTGRVLS